MPISLEKTKLEILFELIRDKKYGEGIDGKALWQPTRELCVPFDGFMVKFKSLNTKDSEKILGLPEQNECDETVLPNHFIRQLVNIPRKHEGFCNLRFILQIALNIGQWCARPIEKYHAIFLQNNLGLISSYLEQEDIRRLDQLITDELFQQLKNSV